MNRRSFFKFLPLAPVALAAEGVRMASAHEAPPDNGVNLTLMGTIKDKYPNRNNLMYLSHGEPQTDPEKSVSMAVGEDGNMWLRSKGGEWKRIVTE